MYFFVTRLMMEMKGMVMHHVVKQNKDIFLKIYIKYMSFTYLSCLLKFYNIILNRIFF